ncbi:MAG: hypothetical protein J1E38_00995 [Paramuribaculum sp.]|nr:hypothetical protein [Paramuribaculum sp.]
MEEKHIIAIETGSSKIKGAVGVVDGTGVISIKAVEEQPLIDCVRHGQLINIVSTSNATKQILKKIENRVSPRKVQGVYVSVGGRSVMSYRREVERRLMPETEITSSLIDQLKNETFSAGIPGREVLAVIPEQYIVDNKKVENPIGVYGTDIKMVSNIIACRPQLKRNLDLLVTDKMGLRIEGYVVRQLAEADIVLTSEEKRLGCMLVDFGAETVTVSIYKHGVLQYLVTIPIGSRHITRDITTLNYLEEDAETIKKQRGKAKKTSGGTIEDIEFADVNNLIRHRAAEIIANIKQQLKPDEKIGYTGFSESELPSGIIIIGRGAKLAEFNEKLAESMQMNVRSGSLITPAVRITDGRIHPSDSIDVISIIYGAVEQGAVDCLTPKPVEVPVEVEDDFEDIPEDEDDTGSTIGKGRSSFWKGVGSKLAGIKKILEEPDENDDDFIDDDENA